MTAIFQYYLAFATISKATLLANSAYNVENFAIPSDAPSLAYGWTEPQRPGTLRPLPARVTLNGDLTYSPDGFYTFAWYWRYFTFAQMGSLLGNFGSGANGYSTLSVPATLQTWFDTTYVAFQALAHRPVWNEQYKSEDGGYSDVILRFSKGVIIT